MFCAPARERCYHAPMSSVVVVTGASMGIGRSLCLAWAKKGATVVMSARGRTALDATAREVEAAGGHAIPVAGDVTERVHRSVLVAKAEAAGGIDVLVNNAGRGYYGGVLDLELDAVRELFELNVLAPLALVQEAAPLLEKARGTVVMISSVAGIVAAPNLGAYSASKFALEALSMSMRAELAAKGVRVVVVRPGPVYTPFRKNAARTDGYEAFSEPDPKAQSADAVAAQVVRAVEKNKPVVETSAYVRVASATVRLAPPAMRRVLRRMASKAKKG